MAKQITACLLAFACLIALPNVASAAIWTWGCQGELGGQQIIFNEDELIILKAGAPAIKPRAFNTDTFSEAMIAAKKDKEPVANYIVHGGGGGLEASLEFGRSGDDKRLVVFSEKTSRRTFHRHRKICSRDEDTDIFTKVYSYQREDEPARDIKMLCVEYQLSTRGGRKGCE